MSKLGTFLALATAVLFSALYAVALVQAMLTGNTTLATSMTPVAVLAVSAIIGERAVKVLKRRNGNGS